jgi:hypothetical protein
LQRTYGGNVRECSVVLGPIDGFWDLFWVLLLGPTASTNYAFAAFSALNFAQRFFWSAAIFFLAIREGTNFWLKERARSA